MHDRTEPGRASHTAGNRSSEGAQHAFERLERIGGAALVSDLAAIYLEDMPVRLGAARAALSSGDASALARVAHAMKSASAQLGGDALAAVCEAAESAAERGDITRAGSYFPAIESHWAEFSAWLTTRVTGAVRADVSPPVQRPVIAVIEDNADNRVLVDALIGDRFVLHEYATGSDALAGMRRDRPDLVLLDVSLPGMDGLEVLGRMRGDPTLRDVPVVAITAHAMAGDRARYLAAGFDEYVAKPIFDEEALVAPIEGLLARSSRTRGTNNRRAP